MKRFIFYGNIDIINSCNGVGYLETLGQPTEYNIISVIIILRDITKFPICIYFVHDYIVHV